MAQFRTHLIGAASVSGVCASGLLVAEVASPAEVVAVFLLGSAGGLLPDLDSDTSRPLRLAFTLLGFVAAFLSVFHAGGGFAVVELVLLWLAIFVGVRVGLFHLFTRFTVHRGLFHSLPAAAIAGLVTTCGLFYFFGLPSDQAWLAGGFVTLGYVVHLLLDELYSVDLLGVELKASFGSAVKPGSLRNLTGTSLLYLSLAGLIWSAPPLDGRIERITSGEVLQTIGARFWHHQAF